jgi:hypothetical protein
MSYSDKSHCVVHFGLLGSDQSVYILISTVAYKRATSVIMDGVPYYVKPSAPVEATVMVMESEAVVESVALGATSTPFWGLFV